MIEIIIGSAVIIFIMLFKLKCKNNNDEEITENIINENNDSEKVIDDIGITYKYNGEEKTCSICLEEIKKNNLIKQLKCFHIYHINCINEWLNIKKICPECNYEF